MSLTLWYGVFNFTHNYISCTIFIDKRSYNLLAISIFKFDAFFVCWQNTKKRILIISNLFLENNRVKSYQFYVPNGCNFIYFSCVFFFSKNQHYVQIAWTSPPMAPSRSLVQLYAIIASRRWKKKNYERNRDYLKTTATILAKL